MVTARLAAPARVTAPRTVSVRCSIERASAAATPNTRRAALLSLIAVPALSAASPALAKKEKRDPNYVDPEYRAKTLNVTKLMRRLVTGDSEREGTVDTDAATFQADYAEWLAYTKPNTNRQTCYSETWKRGNNVTAMIDVCKKSDDDVCKGTYDYTRTIYDSAKYSKRIPEIEEILSSGGLCDGADAFK